MKKNISFFMSVILVACMVMTTGVSVFAVESKDDGKVYSDSIMLESGDTVWQSQFEYTLDDENKTITLKEFTGTVEELVIPATAIINGEEYNVRFEDTCNVFYSSKNKKYLKKISFDEDIDTSNVTDMSYMFKGCVNAESISLKGLDTSKVTKMTEMFSNCAKLTSVDMSDIDTSKVTRTWGMFYDCYNLQSVDFSGVNTHNLEDMGEMFYNCSNLKELDLSGFSTSNVTNMGYMFYQCSSLQEVNMRGFDTSNVNSMSWMFFGCNSLKEIDLSSFNTDKVEYFDNMFSGCGSLRTLDLSNFDMSQWTRANDHNFVGDCDGLLTIKTPIGLIEKEALPYTFVAEDDPSIEYEYMPTKQSSSFTIVRKVNRVTGVEVTPSETTINIGGEYKITANIIPNNAYDKSVVWSSDNEDIATVDKNGTVTGVSLGTAVITATTVDGEYTDTCIVTVVEEEPISDNVVDIDIDNKTALVKDDVLGGNVTVPIEYIIEGKVYRMYDPNRGEHFYTKNLTEMNSLVRAGWQHEANADFIVVDALDIDAIPVYRLYNPHDGGMHFYTADANEAKDLRRVGWSYEGISHYVYKKDATQKGTLQYRQYNPNSHNGEHNWTSDIVERDFLLTIDWVDEGSCWRIVN